jgi:hypothetical protein
VPPFLLSRSESWIFERWARDAIPEQADDQRPGPLPRAARAGQRPGSDHITEKYSVQYIRSEFFVPKLAVREKRAQQKPGDDALSRARARVVQIREDEHKSRLPEDVRARILDRFGAIRRELPA